MHFVNQLFGFTARLSLVLVLRLLQQIPYLPLAIVIPNLTNARLRIVNLHSAIIPVVKPSGANFG
jgi:hypothetical protein